MTEEVFGFLQLCADRRYHRKTMEAFERATGLAPDEYWIEATAGGAPAFEGPTATAEFAYEKGARVMGWAAHGEGCGGFPGLADDALRTKLAESAAGRAALFAEAEHWTLFAAGGRVEADRLSSSGGG
jgi:hypothetical protein